MTQTASKRQLQAQVRHQFPQEDILIGIARSGVGVLRKVLESGDPTPLLGTDTGAKSLLDPDALCEYTTAIDLPAPRIVSAALSPLDWRDLLRDSYLAEERTLTPEWIHYLKIQMDVGSFLPWTDIRIADCAETGRSYLLDGYHRGHAVIAHGKPINFNIQRYDVATYNDVCAFWTRLDSHRVRSSAERVSALGMPNANLLTAAARSLLAGFTSDSNKLERIPDDLLSVVLDRISSHANRYLVAIEPSEGQRVLRTRLLHKTVMAIGVVTIEYCEREAVAFWRGVCERGSVESGSREARLYQFLIDYEGRERYAQLAHAIARFWNDEPLVGRPRDHILIKGTPFDGKADRFLQWDGTYGPTAALRIS